jgi:hypothetical protein
MWWALRWLVEEAADAVEVRMLSVHEAELLDDLRDAPRLVQSGLWHVTNGLNHPGMVPVMMLVVGFPIDRSEDAELLHTLAELAHRRNLVVVAPTAEDLSSDAIAPTAASLGEHPGARFVTLAGPDVVRFTAVGPMRAPASFAVAVLACRAWADHRLGHGLRGALDDVELAVELPPSQSILAAQRGLLPLAAGPEGVSSVVDATLASGELERSLSWTLFFARLSLEAVRVHYRRMGGAIVSDLSAEGTARVIARGLASRFAQAERMHVELDDPRWIVEPELWTASEVPSLNVCGTLEATMRVRMPGDPSGKAETTRSAPIVLHFDP